MTPEILKFCSLLYEALPKAGGNDECFLEETKALSEIHAKLQPIDGLFGRMDELEFYLQLREQYCIACLEEAVSTMKDDIAASQVELVKKATEVVTFAKTFDNEIGAAGHSISSFQGWLSLWVAIVDAVPTFDPKIHAPKSEAHWKIKLTENKSLVSTLEKEKVDEYIAIYKSQTGIPTLVLWKVRVHHTGNIAQDSPMEGVGGELFSFAFDFDFRSSMLGSRFSI